MAKRKIKSHNDLGQDAARMSQEMRGMTDAEKEEYLKRSRKRK